MSKKKRPLRAGVTGPAPRDAAGPLRAMASGFSIPEGHLNAEQWELTLRGSTNWLDSSASLLRAARTVEQRRAADESLLASTGLAHQSAQVVLLAALGVENALKAVIVSRIGADDPLTAAFPGGMKTHALNQLAVRAQVKALDPNEEFVLECGDLFVEWIGRYPVAARPEEQVAPSYHQAVCLAASERIFYRCVEICGREIHARHGAYVLDLAEWLVEFDAVYRRRIAMS